MKLKFPTLPKFSLYTYRYAIAYTLYSVLMAALLLLHLTDLPRGLSSEEMTTAARSATTPLSQLLTTEPINAPYTFLQKASISVFGLTTFAIKLPSVMLAFITGLTLVLMLRQWFRDNIAILTGIVVATAGPFMSMGRSGTALIMHAFWLSIILFAATKKITTQARGFRWKLLFFIACVLSLYTPLMIYPLIAIAAAGLLHPHIRYVLRQLSLVRLGIIAAVSLLLLIPLGISIVNEPSIAATLLGLPSAATSLADIGHNIATVGRMLFDFAQPRIDVFVLPLFSAATMALVGLGIGRTILDRHAARSYMLLLWTSLISIVTILNPAAVTILYMPIILFIAVGIETLIREWYQLFPRNPYARVFGLIPIAILLVSISASNVARYFYGYAYSTDGQGLRSDLTHVRHSLELPALQNKAVTIVSLPAESIFFGLLQREYSTVSAAEQPTESIAHIVTEDAYQKLSQADKTQLGTPYRLVTNGASADALVLRVYVSE